MENIIEWGVLALIAIGGAYMLFEQDRRYDRENSETQEDHDAP